MTGTRSNQDSGQAEPLCVAKRRGAFATQHIGGGQMDPKIDEKSKFSVFVGPKICRLNAQQGGSVLTPPPCCARYPPCCDG